MTKITRRTATVRLKKINNGNRVVPVKNDQCWIAYDAYGNKHTTIDGHWARELLGVDEII